MTNRPMLKGEKKPIGYFRSGFGFLPHHPISQNFQPFCTIISTVAGAGVFHSWLHVYYLRDLRAVRHVTSLSLHFSMCKQ